MGATGLMAANVLECNSKYDVYRNMVSQWVPKADTGNSNMDRIYGLASKDLFASFPQTELGMAAVDSTTYLPDDILCKVDRAAMAASLETRVPLLDHRVIELAWQIPYSMKVKNGNGKWLLKALLGRYVPARLTDRPKMGFGNPLQEWLQGPLRDWAESQLSETRLREEGFFDPELVRTRWNQHVNGQYGWRDSIWLILMWQAWVENINNDLVKTASFD